MLEPVTIPDPVPSLVIVRVYVVVVDRLNVAVQVVSLSIITVVCEAVPKQSPDQPTKVEPESATAVRVTVVPSG